jgi:hypothetical protein
MVFFDGEKAERHIMNAPTDRDIKRLFALSCNRCAHPGCQTSIVQPSGTNTGEIYHIKAKSPKGYDPKQTNEERHAFANLILFCNVHHKIADSEPQRYTVELLQELKEMHERNGNVEFTQDDARLVRKLTESYLTIHANDEAQVMVNSPGGIQAKHVTIKTGSKRKPKIQPTDSIGANSEMRAYIAYLIKRYVDWRLQGIESGKDKRAFHPSMIHKWIQRDFGASTYYVSQNRFGDLVENIQTLIKGTILGGSRKRTGQRNYHSFEDHLKILHGN